MKKYNFYISGMHCNACVSLIESELLNVKGISDVRVSLKYFSIEINGDFGDKELEHIISDLNEVLSYHKYKLSLEKQNHKIKWSDFKIAIPLALAFIGIFIILQKLGIVNLITTAEVGYGTALIIGFVASLSTCMAVVGGLVLSISSSFAKEGDKIRPQILFHIGRLLSFFILGGIIGAFGSVFHLSPNSIFILNLIIAIVLLVLGINLLDISPWTKKFQITLPKSIGNKIHNLKKINHTLTPFILGIATFFLPCGFTQSMQLYTLTTQSFWGGALIMFSFAIGTLPVLLILSFSSLAIHKKAQSGIFFKTSGLIVIFFGIFNIITALVAIGVISPFLNL